MDIRISTFRTAKEGSSEDENEDAFCLRHRVDLPGHVHSLAIADGSSQGLLSREWAEVLVRVFCHADTETAQICEPLLNRAYRMWERWKVGYLRCREEQNRPIKWYEEELLGQGAFSTFLGFTLAEQEPIWSAVAVGDSCLFQVRGNDVCAAFPITRASDFGNLPMLLCSNRTHNDGLLEEVDHIAGEWRVGDRFYLTTDALAQWFLSEHERGQSPFRARFPNSSSGQSAFCDWISRLREEGQLRNDDVTLLCLDVVEGRPDRGLAGDDRLPGCDTESAALL